jgi:hypothetical protein
VKPQTNLRLDPATKSKITALLAHYETQTKVITVAVDHLYQQEIDDKETTMTTKNKTQVNFRLSPAELKQLVELTRQFGESQTQVIGKAIDRMWMTEIHNKKSKAVDRMWCQEMAEDAGEALALADDVRPYSEPDGVCPTEEELAQEAAQTDEPIPAD